MGLKILHISDIHFRDYQDYAYLDLDKDIQREIEIDLEDLKSEYDKIDIILIGGDIAFSGKEEEYKIADSWIETICEICGCKVENVLTVPGNHDVERTKISAVLQDVQKEFKALKSRNVIDPKLTKYLRDNDSTSLLLSPLNNYRSFAQKYGSIPDGANLLFWEKDFDIDGYILRIRGLNSAIVSNESDNEHDSKLFLGSHQTSLIRDKGIINIVMCHHPPQWLYDGEAAQTDLKARAKVHLYGHKHTFSTDILNDCLVLSAGAMQPSRSESDWEPRYNILDISINEENESAMNITLFKRRWDKADKKFIADTKTGGIYEVIKLPLDGVRPPIKKNVSSEANAVNDNIMDEHIIDPNAPNPKRKLAYLFLSLPYHIKIKIAVKLNLVDDSDKDLDEIQKATNYFRRASERNLLSDLWSEVNSASGQNLNNPFN